MLKTLALSASVLAFAGGLTLAETTITREPSTGRSVVTNPSSSLSTDQWLASDVPARLAALARQRGENLIEDPETALAHETVVDRLVRAVAARRVSPP